MTPPWTEALARMRGRIAQTAASVTDGFPHFADPATGTWTTSPGGDWTGGFWNGMLWLAARYGEDPRCRTWASRWTERLAPRARSETVFRGFLFYYGAALGSLLFGDAAARDADWWLAHAPADRVAFWDFDDPKIPDTFRDTSATAIVTASLLTLAPHASTPARARAYRETAETTAAALVERHLRPDGMLSDGCYSPRIGLATRHELVWGSYYLFEALHALAGLYDPVKIA